MMPKPEGPIKTTNYDSPENAKQKAVQKTLDLINSFKKEETKQKQESEFHPIMKRAPG